ncbi:MAG: hypothetical protein NC830_07230 [Candidatus Omnitrophica bacterium]|nr:hypothetical protein [Candidatus Omnitrophota bacterium]
MKVVSINRFKNDKAISCVIGIGKFDGFHIGHQKIVAEIVEMSKTSDCTPAIFTIKNYPAIAVLSTWKERLNAFKNSGIDLCFWADFTDIQKISHEDFLNMLSMVCKIKAIVVGNNFRFGFHRKGNIEFLKSWAEQSGATIKLFSPVVTGGKVVSSSRIKRLIKSSKFSDARKMLGRWYSLKGRCVSGRGVGKNIGFPTINLQIENKNSPLSEGVYACMVKLRSRFYRAIFFYGKPLTFNAPISFEIHIPDIEMGDSYGKNFEVIPLIKIRNPEKFHNAEALANAIKNDIAEMKKIFGSIKFDEINKKV